MLKNCKLNKLGIFLSLLILIIIFGSPFVVKRAAADAPDAIAVRVVPNPNHYSILRWYESQGFLGSPQSITVDGYEAIRDGRTVYVNAANVSGSTVYTNIYMISYSQEPSEKTVDILGQIISHWTFNDGLQDESAATCAISSLSCTSHSDCVAGQKCSFSGLSSGSCILDEAVYCSVDNDCPTNFFCDSKKSRITRDIKRLGRLEEIKNALSNYRENKGRFPELAAGTYLVNKSVSLWPSWQQNFLPEIAVAPSYLDPINRLGYCPGFDKTTCWDAETKSFVYNPEGRNLKLPEGSFAFLYSSASGGLDYNLCAVLETKNIGYSFSPAYPSDSACVTAGGISSIGQANNKAPYLVDSYLFGQADREFNGFVKVADDDNDNLSWSIINANPSTWSSWSYMPVLVDTSNKFQKKIFASKAYKAGSYPLSIKVDDGRGGSSIFDFSLSISNQNVFIEANNESFIPKKDEVLKYSFIVSGDTLPENMGTNIFRINKISGPDNITSSFFSFDGPPVLIGENRYRLNLKTPVLSDSYQFPEDVEIGFEIMLKDKFSKEFRKNFEIKIISEKPVLNFSCPLSARIGQDYSCLIGSSLVLGNNIKHIVIGTLPTGLEMKRADNSNDIYLLGRPEQTSTAAGYPIIIRAMSDFGAYTEKQFNLRVNSFCGDGIKQSPNLEGRGGLYNDGNEQCDGSSGVAVSAQESNQNKQYKCSTFNANTPYEINSSNYCVFAYPLDGGGYCGDGYCQTKYENISSCKNDCSDGSNVSDTSSLCVQDSDCPSDFYCNLSNKLCTKKPFGFCNDTNPCALGFDCVSNTCIRITPPSDGRNDGLTEFQQAER